jgi:hypothetical protein
MKWCCLTFKSWYGAAGERGLAVLVGRNSNGEPEVLIQHRAIDRGVQSLPNVDYPIRLPPMFALFTVRGAVAI